MDNHDDKFDIDDIASVFGGEVVSETAPSVQIQEHMYKPAESVFGAVAFKMVEAGWSIFPQEMTGNRRPGLVDGDMIRWSEQHDLANRKPQPDVLRKWAVQCASLNVAVVLGPASGNTFVIDMDVVEEELSQQIQQLAVRHLGDTPLKRVGRWPKMAFVYRHAPEDEIPSRTLHFVKADHSENPDGDEQLVEIISSGKAMTFYGKHHKTGRYFRWVEGSTPVTRGPDSVPVVTSAQLGDFLDAVDSLRPFSKSASFDMSSVSWEWDENAKVHKPRIRSHGTASDWTENEEGKVSDGREAYLTRLSMRTVMANPTMTGSALGVETLVKTVVEMFTETAEVTGRWRGNQLLREAKSKVYRFAKMMHAGKLKPSSPVQNDKGEYVSSASARGFVPPQPRDPEGDSLDFLPPFVDPNEPGFDFKTRHQRRPMRIEVVESAKEEIEERRKERAISRDRTEIAKSVAAGVDKAFTTVWDHVYDRDRCDSQVHIVKAPTGAGKTSRSIAFIAADPRTYEDFWTRDENGVLANAGRAPILVLMPTYTNIEELRHRAQILNLDGSLSDKDLMKQAADMNLYKEDELEGRLADLRRDARNAGLESMIYSGKLKAGCKMSDKVQMAMSAGLGTSGFCHTDEVKDNKDGTVKTPEKFCPFYHQYEQNADGSWRGCPVIEQRKEIDKCHVVFLPHAFLALQIPEELKNVRAVVADERIHHLFLHTVTFDMAVFASPRKPPKLTKAEVESGVLAEEFQDDRLAAVGEAIYALKTGGDPAEALLKKSLTMPNGGATVDRWINAAIRSCGASMAKDDSINPDISMEELAEVCARPTGVAVREEHRFWKIVQERYDARKQERVMEELIREAGKEFDPMSRTTRGERDMRIQLYVDEIEDGIFKESIRISWRETPNWVDKPLMLLDASAAPEMIQKIWDGKDVVVHDIPAALNVRIVGVADRTYSNSSVIAKPSANQREKVQSAKLLAKVRKAISVISGYYGFSRVVAGGSILARRAVNTNWEGPHNVDWCHYGAMRGLDFAKYHAAAISVGRMELPVRIIDGLVAALTYDDDEPERPFDKYGTGLTESGQPLLIPSENQRVRMRSGHDLYMPVPTFPGRWGRMIQKQYREEELLQFLGRLRPVYREGDAPIWFSLCSVMPEEVIVDDLINIGDLIRRNDKETAVWDALRRCQGVLDVPVAAKVCDDMFPGVAAAAKQFAWEGMNTVTGEIEKRVAWSIVAIKWKDENGDTGYSFARGDIQDPETALRNARIQYELPRIVEAEKVSQSRGQTAARGRTPDSIEDQLGTLPERRDMEERQQLDVAVRLLMASDADALKHLKVKKVIRPVPILMPTGVRRDEENEDSEQITSNLIEIEAAASIEALWRSKGYDVTSTPRTEEVSEAEGDKAVGRVTADRAVAASNTTDDKAQEFDLYRFDDLDLSIPF